jgi:hypothetical protein
MDSRMAGQYKEPIRKGLQELCSRFETMKTGLQEMYSKDQWLLNSLPAYDRSRGVQMSNFLNHYVSELINGLTNSSDGIRVALGESDLPFQAFLYDTLAEEYPTYALAFLFAKKALSDIRSGV